MIPNDTLTYNFLRFKVTNEAQHNMVLIRNC